MTIANILASASVLVGAVASPLFKRGGVPGFDYQNDKIRGVNLGGWFVLEPYMNPSLFDDGWDSDDIPVDEYHWTQKKGKDEAFKILDHHWDTWIQEQDFENLANWGMNFARIPIGYWAFLALPNDPYVQGQKKYLDRAIGWARKHNIKLWVDLHGVPGSQNGFDNSGLRDSYGFQKGDNTDLTLTAFDSIVECYAGSDYEDVVIGIEVVNEPLGSVLDMDKLHWYYNQTYDKIRARGDQGAVFHDAFKSLGYMDDWVNGPDYYNVVIDHHLYQVFTTENLKQSIDEHVDTTCEEGRSLKSKESHWGIVGEWSAALTDCTPLLNGVYMGSRYDGTHKDSSEAIGSCEGINDISTWSDERKSDVRRYVEAQLDAFEYGGAGWVTWAYKTEDTIEWDVQRLIEYGLFPNPVTDRQYPNQCGY